MVPGHDNLMPMRLGTDPIQSLLDLFTSSTLREIASVHEYVAIGHVDNAIMRVRDASDSDR